jgi:serine/threonine-protein kinase
MTTTDVAGKRLGPFEVIERLGEGGMAAVYRGRDTSLRRDVALKVFPADCLKDPGFLERFQAEARIWGRLDHPCIIPLYAAGVDGDTPYLAMKLVRGALSDLLEHGPLIEERAALILADVASALDYAHSQGIVHRDVKPANVLLGEDGRAYLSDFGIAHMSAPGEKSIAGTPGYMAPEQARRPADWRADVYALGCLAYEVLTGVTPFEGDTPTELLRRHQRESPPPPRQIAPWLPEHVEKAVLTAMAKDPSARWPTATLFVQALLGRVDSTGVNTVPIPGHPRALTPPVTTAEPSPPPRASRRSRIVLAAAIACVTLGGAFVLGLQTARTTPTPSATPSSIAPLMSAATRALDQGAYPEALQMADMALRLRPEDANAVALRARIQRAWDAEKKLGLWPTKRPARR